MTAGSVRVQEAEEAIHSRGPLLCCSSAGRPAAEAATGHDGAGDWSRGPVWVRGMLWAGDAALR